MHTATKKGVLSTTDRNSIVKTQQGDEWIYWDASFHWLGICWPVQNSWHGLTDITNIHTLMAILSPKTYLHCLQSSSTLKRNIWITWSMCGNSETKTSRLAWGLGSKNIMWSYSNKHTSTFLEANPRWLKIANFSADQIKAKPSKALGRTPLWKSKAQHHSRFLFSKWTQHMLVPRCPTLMGFFFPHVTTSVLGWPTIEFTIYTSRSAQRSRSR